jgi:hypothetical protein
VNANSSAPGSVTYQATDTRTGLTSNQTTIDWVQTSSTAPTLTSSSYGAWLNQTITLTATAPTSGNLVIFAGSPNANTLPYAIAACQSTTTCVVPMNAPTDQQIPTPYDTQEYYAWSSASSALSTPIYVDWNAPGGGTCNCVNFTWGSYSSSSNAFGYSFEPTAQEAQQPTSYAYNPNGSTTTDHTSFSENYVSNSSGTLAAGSTYFYTPGSNGELPSDIPISVSASPGPNGETWTTASDNLGPPIGQWVSCPYSGSPPGTCDQAGDTVFAFIEPNVSSSTVTETVSPTPTGSPLLCVGVDCTAGSYCSSNIAGDWSYCGTTTVATWDSYYLQIRSMATDAVLAWLPISGTSPVTIPASLSPNQVATLPNLNGTISTITASEPLAGTGSIAISSSDYPSTMQVCVAAETTAPEIDLDYVYNECFVTVNGIKYAGINVPLGSIQLDQIPQPASPATWTYAIGTAADAKTQTVPSTPLVLGTMTIDWTTNPVPTAIGLSASWQAQQQIGQQVQLPVSPAMQNVTYQVYSSNSESGTYSPVPGATCAGNIGSNVCYVSLTNSTAAAMWYSISPNGSNPIEITWYTISLTASTTSPSSGSQITMTISGSPPGTYDLMQIYNNGSSSYDVVVNSCSIGSGSNTCNIPISGSGSETFEATVSGNNGLSVASNQVTVTWQ